MNEEALQQADFFFEALGRTILVLDQELNVIHAGSSFNRVICDGGASKVVGRAVDQLIFGARDEDMEHFKESLRKGRRELGRRALLHCPMRGTRRISVSAAPLDPEAISGDDAYYLVVILPVEDEEVLEQGEVMPGFIAESDNMGRIVHLIHALERSDATVLLTGESGVGKEVVARAIHNNSPCKDQPFVAVNCAAFPETLLENELFGHAKGAYTGAHRDKVGRFELAGRGTLFLDEIGDMPLPLQAKLLRVLQERTFERLGDPTPRKLSARIITATNVDLPQAISDGRFRQDLFYRLSVIPINIPALRERKEDIESLARFLLNRVCRRLGRRLYIASETMRVLLSYSWPGNVRELENAMEFSATFCKGNFIHLEHLPPELTSHDSVCDLAEMLGQAPREPQETQPEAMVCPMPEPPMEQPVADDEKSRILQALEDNRWSKNKAAEILNMSRTTLWRKMRQYGIE